MAKYCDTVQLEREWFNWLLAKSTPVLNEYRKSGVLYTKMCDVVRDKDGKVVTGPGGRTYPNPRCAIKMHFISNANLLIKSENGEILESWENFDGAININEYMKEVDSVFSWHNMLIDINNMCTGISSKFTLQTEEEYQELASEAFIQVTNKLVKDKLIYIPGKAPVFNLLTTTIYRCIYSILNKKNRKKNQTRSIQSTDDESNMVKTHHLCKSYLKV